jgi:3-oxoacyl-[acyl-carrier protein] reductase
MVLKDKKVIVTGGGRGIGQAIALVFAKEGADICITARTQSEIENVAKEIRQLGRQSLAIRGDVTNEKDVKQVVQKTIVAFGRIDILVNNAGGSLESNNPIIKSKPEVWIKTIEVNLIGTYLFSRWVLPHMIKNQGGKIINIGSGMGHRAHSLIGNSAYSVAKAAVWMFTQSLAMEVWKDGIEVNEIVPGPVETRATKKAFHLGKPVPFAESERVKSPDEVAPLAVYLAAQPKNGPTGQSFSLARRPL